MNQNEELEPPTLCRLNALMAAGYEIDKITSQNIGDAIWLEYPARKRTREPTLIIYNNGLVVGCSAKNLGKKELRLYPEKVK